MRLASEDMSIRGSKCSPGAGSGWLSSREPRRALCAFPLAPRPHRIATWKMAVWGGASVPQIGAGARWNGPGDAPETEGGCVDLGPQGSAQILWGLQTLTRGASITGFPFLFQVVSFLF